MCFVTFRPVYGLRRMAVAVAVLSLPATVPAAAQVAKEEALVRAVRAARVEEVRRALDGGTAPTPLALTAAVGLRDPEMLELLIDAGADVNGRARIEDGETMELTPLFVAALSGRSDMALILLDAGADPGATSLFSNMEMTPLDAASMGNRSEIITLLVDAGARAAESVAGAALTEQGMISAIQDGDVEAVRARLDSGADVNGRLMSASTPLSLAAGYPRGRLERQAAMVAILLEEGADVNARNADGSTAFMHAARRGGTKTMALLLEAGADPDARDDGGAHAISYADGYDAAAEVVLDASSDLRSYLSTPGVRDGGA